MKKLCKIFKIRIQKGSQTFWEFQSLRNIATIFVQWKYCWSIYLALGHIKGDSRLYEIVSRTSHEASLSSNFVFLQQTWCKSTSSLVKVLLPFSHAPSIFKFLKTSLYLSPLPIKSTSFPDHNVFPTCYFERKLW